MMLALSAPFSCSGLLRRARPAAAPSTPLAGPRRCSVLVRAEFKSDDKGREAYKTSPVLPAFTRRREHFVGRLAAFGLASGLVGEVLTGLGPIGQLHLETGLSEMWLYFALLVLVGISLFGGTSSVSPTFDPANQRDARKRVDANPAEEPGKFIAQSEILFGRVGMLGFASACALEYLWNGQAPLAHLGLINPGGQAPWWLIVTAGTLFASGLGVFTALGNTSDESAY